MRKIEKIIIAIAVFLLLLLGVLGIEGCDAKHMLKKYGDSEEDQRLISEILAKCAESPMIDEYPDTDAYIKGEIERLLNQLNIKEDEEDLLLAALDISIDKKIEELELKAEELELKAFHDKWDDYLYSSNFWKDWQKVQEKVPDDVYSLSSEELSDLVRNIRGLDYRFKDYLADYRRVVGDGQEYMSLKHAYEEGKKKAAEKEREEELDFWGDVAGMFI